jgi:uncharacterized protein (UPF0332 family)
MERAKAHDALRHLTSQEKRALAEYLSRLEADCKDEAQFSEEEARRILDDAERFVARLEEYLRSVKAIE